MATKTGRCRQKQTSSQPTIRAAAPQNEPVMRRWPHPVSTVTPQEESTLHYITCALSYQNQLLADIKVLLERFAAEAPFSACDPAAREKK